MPDYRRRIRREAERFGVPADLLLRQLQQESGLNPNARSPAGAQGIAQFMPGTAKTYGVNLHDNRAGDDIRGAAQMMRDLLRRFNGNEAEALAAYNAGAGAVERYHGVPPFAETKAYVRSILGTSHGKTQVPSSAAEPDPQARQAALLAYVNDRHNPDALLSLAQGLQADVPKGPSQPSQPSQSSQPFRQAGGITDFDGKPIPAGFVGDLEYARQHGWDGVVTSGVRSRQQQASLKAHPQGYPVADVDKSNHVLETGGEGAVDVTKPEKLWEIIRHKPGRVLRWAPTVGLNDRVHFSPTGR